MFPADQTMEVHVKPNVHFLWRMLALGSLCLAGCQGDQGATRSNGSTESLPAANENGPYTPGSGDWANDPSRPGIIIYRGTSPTSQPTPSSAK
jgi:hypothetical protein